MLDQQTHARYTTELPHMSKSYPSNAITHTHTHPHILPKIQAYMRVVNGTHHQQFIHTNICLAGCMCGLTRIWIECVDK